MKVSFEGIGELMATFYNNADKAAVAGDCVKMAANGEVAACAAGEAFCGVCTHGDAEFAAVQLKGFVQRPYTGSAPAVGVGMLASDGNGGVQAGSGTDVLILDVDTTAKTVGFML